MAASVALRSHVCELLVHTLPVEARWYVLHNPDSQIHAY